MKKAAIVEKMYWPSPCFFAMACLLLPGGVSMPQFGIGTYQGGSESCEPLVLHALKTGYRLIDTAEGYNNEDACAAAIASTRRIVEIFTTVEKMRSKSMPNFCVDPSATSRALNFSISPSWFRFTSKT